MRSAHALCHRTMHSASLPLSYGLPMALISSSSCFIYPNPHHYHHHRTIVIAPRDGPELFKSRKRRPTKAPPMFEKPGPDLGMRPEELKQVKKVKPIIVHYFLTICSYGYIWCMFGCCGWILR
jgi:hypothetical protein